MLINMPSSVGGLPDDKSVRNVAVKLKKVDEHGNVITTAAVTAPVTNTVVDAPVTTVAAVDATDIIEEDLGGPQPPQAVVTEAVVAEEAATVAPATSEAVVTLASSASITTENKTIVIANLGEEHKDILNAILVDGTGGPPTTEAATLGPAESAESVVASEAAAVVEEVVAATESAVPAPEPKAEIREEEDGGEPAAEETPPEGKENGSAEPAEVGAEEEPLAPEADGEKAAYSSSTNPVTLEEVSCADAAAEEKDD